MNPSQAGKDERLPVRARHEIVVDDALDDRKANGPSFVTPVVLFGGLLLTLVLSRIGIHFFFLPIIIPFGLGGGRMLRKLLPPPRRVLRLENGSMWLSSEGPWKTTIVDRLDVGAGAFVALGTTGLWNRGLEDARVRVVSTEGALAVAVRGGERAHLLLREIMDALEADDVPGLDAETPLQGDVWAEPYEDGEQIEWSSGPASGLFDARSATVLRVTPEGWALRVRTGASPVVSTGGPGVLEAHLAPADLDGPLGATVAPDARMLELFANDGMVGRVGTELSEPELRWIALRIERATRLQH
ncbi:MAG TPA: hypothetical protein VH062_09390 [Polyangiaceae bacterium]|nr:hypothetical protein [Polyangiaceae bacterium]